MKAEIITIGDEILIGQIVDTNSAWLSEKLGSIGVRVSRITSVGDCAEQIIEAVEQALVRSQIVLTTGGLGPTKDDITKLTLAKMFDSPLVIHQPTFDAVGEMLAKRGVEFNELNRSQALVPEKCEVIMNPNGTAPGMWFERGGAVLVSMPGVPFEMKRMSEDELLPRLKKHFQLDRNVHKTMITFGIPESVLAQTIAPWEDALPQHLHLAYLPSLFSLRLRLSSYETNQDDALAQIEAQFSDLEKIIPQSVLGYGEISLEQVVGQMLVAQGATVATAESCTGGNIAHRFTANAGASEYFVGGVVSYSNSAKESILGVKRESLQEHGAVSRQVAEQMAQGARQKLGSTYAISTTGIAGPDGGSDEKPVGTVWIALATPSGVQSRCLSLGRLREQNIERASSNAINLLRLYLRGE